MSTRILVVSVLAVGCFEFPTLDDLPPTPPDLASVDTWSGLTDGAELESDLGDGESWTGTSSDEETTSDDGGDPGLAALRITEVLADPDGTDGAAGSPELVEIWNPGVRPVQLGELRVQAEGWPIVDGVELGLAGVVLAPDGILLIERYASDVEPAGVQIEGPLVVASFSTGSGLRNADGAVGVGPSAGFSDVLVYGLPVEAPFDLGWVGEPAAATGSGQSLCRSTMLADHDVALDWVGCTPSPGELGSGDSADESDSDSSDSGVDTDSETGDEPEPIPVGALAIVEVLGNPPGPATDEKAWEYVEIVNLSPNELELSNLRIGDDPSPAAAGIDPLAFVAGDGGCESPTCLAPGQRALIVAQGYLGQDAGGLVLATDDTTIADGGLTNSEPVVIWDAFDSMVSSYRIWPDPSGDPLPIDEQPLHRIDPAGIDEPANWESAPPSPGS